MFYYVINLFSSVFNLFSSVFQCRIDLEQTRLLVLEAADQLDRFGNKKARGILAMAKVIFLFFAHVLFYLKYIHGLDEDENYQKQCFL